MRARKSLSLKVHSSCVVYGIPHESIYIQACIDEVQKLLSLSLSPSWRCTAADKGFGEIISGEGGGKSDLGWEMKIPGYSVYIYTAQRLHSTSFKVLYLCVCVCVWTAENPWPFSSACIELTARGKRGSPENRRRQLALSPRGTRRQSVSILSTRCSRAAVLCVWIICAKEKCCNDKLSYSIKRDEGARLSGPGCIGGPGAVGWSWGKSRPSYGFALRGKLARVWSQLVDSTTATIASCQIERRTVEIGKYR